MDDQDSIQDMYVYDLPYVERNELCSILDINNQWEILGGKYMKFGRNDLERFRRAGWCEKSPTDRMLQEWGQQNNTILELFLFLYEMGHYQAMSSIKSCVPVQFHTLFNPRERFKSMFEGEGIGKGPPKTNRNERAGIGLADVQNSVARAVAAAAATAANDGDGVQPFPKAKVEGAAALPIPVHLNCGSENLNKTSSSPRGQLASKKVPEALLCPSPAAAENLKPMSAHPPYARQNGHLGSVPEAKVLNNEQCGRMTEVSCEDNNHQEFDSARSKASAYRASQDYIRMVEEKRAKIEGEAADRQMSNQNAQASDVRHRVNGAVGLPSENYSNVSVPVHQQHAASNNHQYRHYPPTECRRQMSSTSAVSSASKQSECVLPMIPYKELEEATACWNKDNFLGRGGFGVVFKGKWKNSAVAVKKLQQPDTASESAQLLIEEALGELKLCLSHQHDNILQVYGYSVDPGQPPCLVYQFMPNGSVEDRLLLREVGATASNNWAPLSWRQRFVIALGTAKALQFLHTVNQTALIHGDVKSANILLDKHLEPKLGDFGLAREGKSQSASLKVSRINGTRAYLPNDFLRTKKLSVKVDTYSYGIVLLELCTGQRAEDKDEKGETKYLKLIVENTPAAEEESLRDPNVGKDGDYGIFHAILTIAKKCVLQFASRRPYMQSVFSDLENYQSYKLPKVDMHGPPTSPYHIQVGFDMAGRYSVTPGKFTQLSVSPSPQSSTFMHPSIPQVPNPHYQPPNPHYQPPYSIHPQDVYRYRHLPPRHFYNPWKQVNGDAYHHGMGNPAFYEARPVLNPIPSVPASSEQPPTYIEAVSPTGCAPVGVNNGPVNALLPDLSALNISSESCNSNKAKDGGAYLPFLPELGQALPSTNQSGMTQPTAANKKFSFCDDDDDDDDDDSDSDDDD